ncbi:hypothetical protein VP01_2144g1 [Puccinia sorghi]|uniref:Uncharacterized protein n=1 Tax=Puccinia sorghi TaxID=27349 RepID=A0A0L6VBJ5_9BASI|nr:hypothetical protein VP01_2144g1 [Puccinia sorghi]
MLFQCFTLNCGIVLLVPLARDCCLAMLLMVARFQMINILHVARGCLLYRPQSIIPTTCQHIIIRQISHLLSMASIILLSWGHQFLQPPQHPPLCLIPLVPILSPPANPSTSGPLIILMLLLTLLPSTLLEVPTLQALHFPTMRHLAPHLQILSPIHQTLQLLPSFRKVPLYPSINLLLLSLKTPKSTTKYLLQLSRAKIAQSAPPKEWPQRIAKPLRLLTASQSSNGKEMIKQQKIMFQRFLSCCLNRRDRAVVVYCVLCPPPNVHQDVNHYTVPNRQASDNLFYQECVTTLAFVFDAIRQLIRSSRWSPAERAQLFACFEPTILPPVDWITAIPPVNMALKNLLVLSNWRLALQRLAYTGRQDCYSESVVLLPIEHKYPSKQWHRAGGRRRKHAPDQSLTSHPNPPEKAAAKAPKDGKTDNRSAANSAAPAGVAHKLAHPPTAEKASSDEPASSSKEVDISVKAPKQPETSPSAHQRAAGEDPKDPAAKSMDVSLNKPTPASKSNSSYSSESSSHHKVAAEVSVSSTPAGPGARERREISCGGG